jgi:hypothetical protein
MKLRPLFALALAAAVLATPAAARAQMPAGPALVVDARLGLGVGLAGTSGVIIVPSLDLGVRLINRLQITLGFGLFRTATPIPRTNDYNADTSFTLIPAVAVDILRSRDNHVAWYGKASLPLGVRVVSSPLNDTNLFVIGYDVALGARYCPHPNFAFGLEGGITGLFVDPAGDNGSGTTTFYGALVGTFYWGKGS